jgi:hypothetical protein
LRFGLHRDKRRGLGARRWIAPGRGWCGGSGRRAGGWRHGYGRHLGGARRSNGINPTGQVLQLLLLRGDDRLLLPDQFAERGDLVSGVRWCRSKRAGDKGEGQAAARHLVMGS